jgi:hypothetical protein
MACILTFSRQQEVARRFIACADGEKVPASFRQHGFLDNRATL